MSDDSFHRETNPFRALNAKCFPGDRGKSAVLRPKAAKNAPGQPSAGRRSQKQDARQDDDDPDLFFDAVGFVRTLRPRGREVAVRADPESVPPLGAETDASGLQRFMEGELEFALSLTDEYVEGHVVGLDPAIMNKLRIGALSPEAHLDLHGLNAVQAFESLRSFMRGCWYKGMRAVLVVPGRGRNSPLGMGVLREKLPNWLTQEPFKRVVLAFCTARPHDGGLGGVYVLLRKYRKKGKIFWEKMPADADLYLSN